MIQMDYSMENEEEPAIDSKEMAATIFRNMEGILSQALISSTMDHGSFLSIYSTIWELKDEHDVKLRILDYVKQLVIQHIQRNVLIYVGGGGGGGNGEDDILEQRKFQQEFYWNHWNTFFATAKLFQNALKHLTPLQPKRIFQSMIDIWINCGLPVFPEPPPKENLDNTHLLLSQMAL